MELVQTSKQNLIKHNAAIHCSNSLSLLQRKISNALLYHAYENLMINEIHEIEMAYLCRLIGYSGHNYAAIKEAFKQLISTVIEWNLVDDMSEDEDWSASSLLASVRIKGNKCYYEYSHRLKQLFFEPSIYSKINMVVQSKFKSNYGLALYENTVRYRKLQFSKWFDIALFRKLMGIPDEKYQVFRDFKKRVLDKSVEEVNKYSDIFVELELSRQGKKVVKVRFKIKERKKRTKFTAHQTQITKQALSYDIEKCLLKEFGFSVKQVAELVTQYDEKYIQEKINLVKSSASFQLGKIKHLSKYLQKALADNFQCIAVKKQSLDQVNKNHDEKEKAPTIQILPNETEQKALEKTCLTCFYQLDIKTQASILDGFEIFLSSTAYHDTYLQSGLTDPLITMQFVIYLSKRQTLQNQTLLEEARALIE